MWAITPSVGIPKGVPSDRLPELTVGGRLGHLGLTDVLLLGDGLCHGREVRIRGPGRWSAL